jgi:hypothetical protein
MRVRIPADCQSVRHAHEKTREQLDGLLWIVIPKNSTKFQYLVGSDMKMTLYKILMHFCTYFAKYASERNVFRTNVGLYEMHSVMYMTLLH